MQNPGVAISNALTFTITDPSMPATLTTLSPSSAVAGLPAFTLTVNGSNFVSGSVVRWNGTNRATTFVSATQLTAAITAADIAAAGSASVTVQNPGVAISNALTFTITSATFIWPSSTVPGIVDQGPDDPVELGVKFYSDVGGTITGIRFYKSSANTGTHVGSLWSSTGTLLATATFTGETASGWQQANFATPVSINSSAIYVASYHANTGHYSFNPSYFDNTNRDNSPLHAPLSGGPAGGNGVYAYGASSDFPNQTFNSNNYWVDVVFQVAVAAPPTLNLNSIAVTPANPTIMTGATQQFTAMGTYSDGSTQNITNQVTGRRRARRWQLSMRAGWPREHPLAMLRSPRHCPG